MDRYSRDIMSTRSLPQGQQFDAWASWMAGVFDVAPPTPRQAVGFCAEHRFWRMDDLTIALASAPSLRIRRTPELVRRNPIDHWVLSLAGAPMRLRLGEADHLVPGGTPFLASLRHSFDAQRPADRRLHIYLPRDRFRSLDLFDAVTGILLDTSLGRLLGSFLRALASRLPDVPDAEMPHVREAVRAMVNACLAPDTDRLAEAAQHLDETRRLRLRSLIRQNLTSPELGVATLCRLEGLSRTQLYQLFEKEGGVLREIQRRRLQACRGLLADAANTTPVHLIASQHGFEDSSHFSRIFRLEFGLSPSEVRDAARADAPIAAPRFRSSDRGLSDHLMSL